MEWVGTSFGPERKLVQTYGIKFTAITCGRWRRYFSLQNIFDLFKIVVGFMAALAYLINSRPQALVTAGSYVAVPLAWAAWVLRVPILVHQQDLRIGLANKLVLPFAKTVTAAWPDIAKHLAGRNAPVIGNPVRRQIMAPVDKIQTLKKLGWPQDKPVVLVMGGGTGAEFINTLLIKNLTPLTSLARIIHITGDNKSAAWPQSDYQSFPLAINEVASFFQLADLVITRAGMGTMAELSALGKPAIIIPIPRSHQEVNAEFVKSHGAAVVLNQLDLDNDKFVAAVNDLLRNHGKLSELSGKIDTLMPKDAARQMADLILKLMA